jgi:hypothetical protein
MKGLYACVIRIVRETSSARVIGTVFHKGIVRVQSHVCGHPQTIAAARLKVPH